MANGLYTPRGLGAGGKLRPKLFIRLLSSIAFMPIRKEVKSLK
jgi:hypothetical protein